MHSQNKLLLLASFLKKELWWLWKEIERNCENDANAENDDDCGEDKRAEIVKIVFFPLDK